MGNYGTDQCSLLEDIPERSPDSYSWGFDGRKNSLIGERLVNFMISYTGKARRRRQLFTEAGGTRAILNRSGTSIAYRQCFRYHWCERNSYRAVKTGGELGSSPKTIYQNRRTF